MTWPSISEKGDFEKGILKDGVWTVDVTYIEAISF